MSAGEGERRKLRGRGEEERKIENPTIYSLLSLSLSLDDVVEAKKRLAQTSPLAQMRRLASLATAQTAAAGSQFVQKSKSGAVGALFVRSFFLLFRSWELKLMARFISTLLRPSPPPFQSPSSPRSSRHGCSRTRSRGSCARSSSTW